jgi:hypothetical protein
VHAGRRAHAFTADGGRGLVSRAFEPGAVRAFVEARMPSDALELRRYRGSALDLFRGSAARRAWAIAHALEASDLACATPVAFLEWRRFGVPVRSALVVAARGHEPACETAHRAQLIADLRARLREAGFAARELDAHGLALTERDGRIEPCVRALEALAFPTRLTRC